MNDEDLFTSLLPTLRRLEARCLLAEQIAFLSISGQIRSLTAESDEPRRHAQLKVLALRNELFAVLVPDPDADETEAEKLLREEFLMQAKSFFDRLEVACLE